MVFSAIDYPWATPCTTLREGTADRFSISSRSFAKVNKVSDHIRKAMTIFRSLENGGEMSGGKHSSCSQEKVVG